MVEDIYLGKVEDYFKGDPHAKRTLWIGKKDEDFGWAKKFTCFTNRELVDLFSGGDVYQVNEPKDYEGNGHFFIDSYIVVYVSDLADRLLKILKDNIKLKNTPVFSEKEGRYLEKYTLEIDEAINKETFNKLKEILK